jgi:uncharacterized protein (TIGR00369 family)
MNLQELSGLELLNLVKQGTLPHPSMADTIPMQMIEAERGSAVFQAVASEKHLNPMGGVHGGFAATVLDSVTGCAVHTMLAPGESYGTVDLNVKLLKPVPVGKTLTARGTVINMSKRLGVSQATLTDDEGAIYAHATCTCMILRNRDSIESPGRFENNRERRSGGPPVNPRRC